MQILTQQRLKNLFSYDPKTGLFKRRSTRKIAKPDRTGYVRIYIKPKLYLAHRLAWLYYYGEFPKINIDHINNNPNDNRIKNLRESSYKENAINIPNRSNNITGVVGVSLHKASNKWQARISDNKKNIALGIFDLFTDAVKARYNAEIRLKYYLINNNSSAKKYLKDNNLLK